MQEIVAVNGQIFKPEEARISVFDRGFLYGDGVYEVARSYNGIFFGLEDHIDRLFHSAQMIDLDIGLSRVGLIKEIYRIHRESQIPDSYMRVVVTRGEGRINLDPAASTKANIVVFIRPLDPIDPAFYEKGVDLIMASVLRNTKKALDPNVKSGNYLNNILALAEAKKKKAYDALMINREGYVTEGTTFNIFFVKNKTIVTSPDEADILQGITRKTLIKIAHREHLKCETRFFTPQELKNADEAFTSSSVKEVMPVRTIDGVKIGSAPGELTKKFSQLYKQYVADYCKHHKTV